MSELHCLCATDERMRVEPASNVASNLGCLLSETPKGGESLLLSDLARPKWPPREVVSCWTQTMGMHAMRPLVRSSALPASSLARSGIDHQLMSSHLSSCRPASAEQPSSPMVERRTLSSLCPRSLSPKRSQQPDTSVVTFVVCSTVHCPTKLTSSAECASAAQLIACDRFRLLRLCKCSELNSLRRDIQLLLLFLPVCCR